MTKRFNLPVWLKNGLEVTKLAEAFGEYWDKVEGWVKTPLSQLDAETCHVTVLKLMAYQRDVDRFAGEPDDLFRKRVAFAVQNATDAGLKSGFTQIFDRLGIGNVELYERVDEVEWDVITLRLSDSQLSENRILLDLIIQKYGRTCRRYRIEVITYISIGVVVEGVGHLWSFDVASN